MKTSNLISRL